MDCPLPYSQAERTVHENKLGVLSLQISVISGFVPNKQNHEKEITNEFIQLSRREKPL